MSRSITLEKVVDYFKDGNLDVAEITLLHVTNIVGTRRQRQQAATAQTPAPIAPRKARKQRTVRTGTGLASTVASGTTATHETLADA